jgi:SPP1 family predicted phage head-tail adaptor
MLRAGELRQRVTVERSTEVSDGHDGFTQTWSALYRRIAARLRPLLGRDLERARQTDPRVSHEVTLRYWRTYSTDLAGGRVRLIYHDVADRRFEIVSAPVDVEERHEMLSLLCREAA